VAVSEDDHRILDDYLSNKRQAIAAWRNEYHRCHRRFRRGLRAELRGEDYSPEPIPNSLTTYWDDPLGQLHKLLFPQ
jgi:hypothetical protein